MFFFRNGHEAINAKADIATEQNVTAVKKKSCSAVNNAIKLLARKVRLTYM
jgi:hypothetical protein